MEQPPYISAEQCRRTLTPARALELAETALRWEATGRVRYPEAGAARMRVPETGFRYHSKTVALPEVGVVGSRVVGYTVAPDGTRPGADEATRMIVLMDIADGRPLAIVDEHYNYALRTAASVGVAVRMVVPRPVRLGVVGAGVVARSAVRVLLEALEVTELVLSSRTRSRCEQLAEETRHVTDVGISIAASPADVIAGCDVVVLATTTKSPIQAGALRPGLVLCALGSNEIGADGYRSASHLVVDDWSQTRAAGDVAAMIAAGLELEESTAVPLPRLVAGDVAVEATRDESMIIRTEGLASQDVLFAHHVWQETSR